MGERMMRRSNLRFPGMSLMTIPINTVKMPCPGKGMRIIPTIIRITATKFFTKISPPPQNRSFDTTHLSFGAKIVTR